MLCPRRSILNVIVPVITITDPSEGDDESATEKKSRKEQPEAVGVQVLKLLY